MSLVQRRIRQASRADLAAVSSLIQRTVAISNAPDYSADEISHTIASYAVGRLEERFADREIYVAVEADRVIGVASISLANGRLHALFVDPDRQGGGLGRDLLGYVEGIARRAGWSEMVLSSSVRAVGFYEGLGYCVLASERGPHGLIYAMTKRLSGESSEVSQLSHEHRNQLSRVS